MIVADTDVLIDALSGVEPARSRIDLELSAGRLSATVITGFELLSGARRVNQRKKIERLLGALTILPLEFDSGRIAAEIRLELEAKGEAIGMADYLIAGICLSRSVPLLSRNRAHFERVPGLQLAELTRP